jgi:hypothetical protein
VFTIEEVNALIPVLSEMVKEQMARHGQIAEHLVELTRLCGKVPATLADQPHASDTVLKLKGTLRTMIQQYADGWNDVESLGGVVKDPQIGTVDFYSTLDGRAVWLCWQFGEETLGYYHELDAGFAGRKPLCPDVRVRSLN